MKSYSSYSCILVTIGIATLGSFMIYEWKKRKSEHREVPLKYLDEENWITYCLLEGERHFLHTTPIPTVTFYKGDLPSSSVSTRLEEILTVNPWLSGRLIQHNESSPLCSAYPKKFDRSMLSAHFQEVTIDNTPLSKEQRFHETSTLDVLLSHVESFFVKKGIECLNKEDGVIFKVVVVKVIDYDEDDNNTNVSHISNQKQDVSVSIIRTALIVSMSHVIGDGYTYYKIFSAFDREKPIPVLLPQRKSFLYQELTRLQGSSFFISPLFLMSFFWTVMFRPVPNIQVYKVNKIEIEKMKENHFSSTKGVTYLSTNDILSAWFFKACNLSFGFMPCNVRNRINGLTSDLAGNYLGFIFYDKDDYNYPENIRKSLSRLSSHPEIGKSKVPSLWEQLKLKYASITNWSTFFHEVHFNEEINPFIIHYPIISKKLCSTHDFMVIFSPRKDEVSIMIMSRSLNKESDWLIPSNSLISK
jgi:hypothetical protein